MAVFIICTNKKCDGPGVAEYLPDFDLKAHKCGFCDSPLREPTGKEVEKYKLANPSLWPVKAEEENGE